MAEGLSPARRASSPIFIAFHLASFHEKHLDLKSTSTFSIGSGSWQMRSEETYGYRKRTIRRHQETNDGGNHIRTAADRQRQWADARTKRAGTYEYGEQDDDYPNQILLQHQGAESD